MHLRHLLTLQILTLLECNLQNLRHFIYLTNLGLTMSELANSYTTNRHQWRFRAISSLKCSR